MSALPMTTHDRDSRLVLAFDTGSPITSVALARGGEVLAHEAAERASKSDSILALIDAVLSRCGAGPRDLGALCVLRGPGSFTGLRIGLATALGLHDALGLAVAAMPTLHVLAAAALEVCATPVDRVIAVVDALRGEWFAQGFARRAGLGGPLEPLGPPEIVDTATLAALTPAALAATSLAPTSLGPVALVGFGASAIVVGAAASGGGASLIAIEPPLLAPVAARLAGSWATWDPSLLTEPLYLRPAPATPAKRQGPAPSGASAPPGAGRIDS